MVRMEGKKAKELAVPIDQRPELNTDPDGIKPVASGTHFGLYQLPIQTFIPIDLIPG